MSVSDETRAWFGRLVADTRERFAGLAELGDDPERLYGEARSSDGVVAVVAPGGMPVRLTLSASAMRLGPEELAERIVATQREAAAEAGRRQAEAVQELIGPATGGAVDVRSMVDRALDQGRFREAEERLDSADEQFGRRR
ncbi:hypothetical protein ACQPWW_17030 [Micromonospora sp. CA-240977]|uniref:hypothetical protein n=1 Tax=Micromonospora sp. CA-240977 TaxID=3239957 RepID=UPI003D8B9A06